MTRSRADIPTISKLAAKVQHLPGDVAEFGVYEGGSAVELCRLFPTRQVHLFDSCQGLPRDRGPMDGDRPGAFAASREVITATLAGHDNWTLHEGWFADTLRVTGNIDCLCFAHVDCDYAASYADCVPWILARLATGGIVQFDDYGGACCKGATKYLDYLLGHELVTHAGHGAHWVKVADAWQVGCVYHRWLLPCDCGHWMRILAGSNRCSGRGNDYPRMDGRGRWC